MSFNLLSTIQGLFSGDFIKKAGSQLDETEASVKEAVRGMVPTILTGILSRAGSGDVDQVFQMAKTAARSGILHNIHSTTAEGISAHNPDMSGNLFGDKTNAVATAIAQFAGIKDSSAASLLGTVTPVSLAVIGKQALESNLTTSGFLNMLNAEKSAILNSLPSGLGLASALGLTNLNSIGTQFDNAVTATASRGFDYKSAPVSDKKPGGAWLLPLILIVAAAALLFYLMRGCGGNKPIENVTENIIDSLDAGRQPEPPVENIKVQLPDGNMLDAYRGGIEDKLVTFLNDPATAGGKDVWFDFDNLNFESGSAEITTESMRQIRNIVAILRAYPTVVAKIGGYTDRTGDSIANLRLSQARADAVNTALKNNGAVPAQLEEPEGYGSQFATVPASALDNERQKDRRIAVGIRKK